ncbi:MAG: MnmC family methyltransferase [Campylobacterota bacterium]|nr:MnmC family methyltransferase [Campylobacterota bacterium]
MSEDGSYTAYSKEYDEHYHSTKDGALHESLLKHVIPAFKIKSDFKEINILDICFGLGFNTLATLYYARKNFPHAKINIYSPELDSSLVKSLNNFIYPKEFEAFKNIIKCLVEDGIYDDGLWHVELYLGDAREYIKKFPQAKFDMVYQDAFSPSVNPILWSKEYFSDIRKIIKDDGILTTYSTALATRLALYENGFSLYVNSGEGFRNATVACVDKLDMFDPVDIQHKISCNPHAKPLRD